MITEGKGSKFGWFTWMAVGLILVAAVIIAVFKFWPNNTAPQAISPGINLGEEGAKCGGEMRLPCKPGLECNAQNQNEGTCVKSNTPVQKAQPTT